MCLPKMQAMRLRAARAVLVMQSRRSALVRRLWLPPRATQQARPKCTATAVDQPLTGEELQRSGTVRPFSDIPMAGGAVPFLGHYPIIRLHPGVKQLELIRRWFKELGPIFKVKLPCKPDTGRR